MYGQKGRAGCSAPVIYTSELDAIVREAAGRVAASPEKLIDDMVEIYRDIGEDAALREDMARLKEEIGVIRRRKDKLLDLCLSVQISDGEFKLRNEAFNQQLVGLAQRLENLAAEETRRQTLAVSSETLRPLLARALTFPEGFTCGIVDAVLDRIEVGEEDCGKTPLRIFLKGGAAPPLDYTAILICKPRALLFDPEHPYHPRQCQHGDHPLDRHGKAM